MTITPAQKRSIAIKFPKKEDRELVVAQYTNDATKTSTKDLTFAQANSLLKATHQPATINRQLFFDKTNAQHRRIISTCIQIGWALKHDRYGEVADLEHLKNWLLGNKCPVKSKLPHCGLNGFSPFELSKIIIALDNMNFKHHEKQSKQVPAS